MRSHTYSILLHVLLTVRSNLLFLLRKNKRTKVFYIQTLTEAELSTAYAHTYPQASYPQHIHKLYTVYTQASYPQYIHSKHTVLSTIHSVQKSV